MSWAEGAVHDLRHAIRLIRRSPLVSSAMIATLAIGVGLDTGVFTVVNGVLFRPRVAEDPASFVELHAEDAGGSRAATGQLFSLDEVDAYRASPALRDLAAWTPTHATLGGLDDAGAVPQVPLLVTCNFFAVFGAPRPVLGRLLTGGDCDPSAAESAVVIGEDLWHTSLAADPEIVGKQLFLDHRRYRIVGVVPSGYAGQLRGPIWLPYTAAPAFYGGRALPQERTARWLQGLNGRLASGLSRATASAALSTIAQARFATTPDSRPSVRATSGAMIDLPVVQREAAWIVPLTLGAFGLVLLIACGNAALLVLSRSAARRREIAIRSSLGATRARLLRMLLTESTVYAVVAVPVSALLARAVPTVFKLFVPTLPVYPFDLDRAVFAYLAAATILAGILGGLAPALESLRRDVSGALGGDRQFVGGRTTWRTRDVLMAAQIAMSVILVSGAALFVATEVRMLSRGPGYETDHVLLVSPAIASPPLTADTAAGVFRTLLDRLAAAPGVRGVATTGGRLDGESPPVRTLVADDGRTIGGVSVSDVSPSYFATLGMRVVRGSVFTDTDAAAGSDAVVVSESLARALTDGGDALAARVRFSGDRAAMRIVAIVADVTSPLTSVAGEPAIYRPLRGSVYDAGVLVRFDGDQVRAIRTVREIMTGVDARIAAEPRTLSALRRDAAERFLRLVEIVTSLAAVALVLAMVGIYGVVGFAAARRAREFIRVALGATRANIMSLVVLGGLRPFAIGAAVGLGIALAAARVVAGFFARTPVRLDALDPLPYAAVVVILMTTAVGATIGPAYRAAASDPVNALRQE